MDNQKNPWGMFYIILGAAIFLFFAGNLIIKLALAALGIWLMLYGVQMWTGRPLTMIFFNWRNRD
jgi:hypothetical protein